MTMKRANRHGTSPTTAAGLTVLLAVAIGVSVLAAQTKVFKGAGIRSSTYGRPNDPGPGYWARTGTEIAAKFPGAKPEAIWIVSRLKGRGTEMSFPVPPGGDPLITGMPEDISEPVLQLFDKLGYRVWLQTEPGWAPVEKAFDVMLDRYGHHKCVIGVGVDIEWHRSNNPDLGDPVTDEMARAWLAAARSHNPSYRMFLKHFRERRHAADLPRGHPVRRRQPDLQVVRRDDRGVRQVGQELRPGARRLPIRLPDRQAVVEPDEGSGQGDRRPHPGRDAEHRGADLGGLLRSRTSSRPTRPRETASPRRNSADGPRKAWRKRGPRRLRPAFVELLERELQGPDL